MSADIELLPEDDRSNAVTEDAPKTEQIVTQKSNENDDELSNKRKRRHSHKSFTFEPPNDSFVFFWRQFKEPVLFSEEENKKLNKYYLKGEPVVPLDENKKEVNFVFNELKIISSGKKTTIGKYPKLLHEKKDDKLESTIGLLLGKFCPPKRISDVLSVVGQNQRDAFVALVHYLNAQVIEYKLSTDEERALKYINEMQGEYSLFGVFKMLISVMKQHENPPYEKTINFISDTLKKESIFTPLQFKYFKTIQNRLTSTESSASESSESVSDVSTQQSSRKKHRSSRSSNRSSDDSDSDSRSRRRSQKPKERLTFYDQQFIGNRKGYVYEKHVNDGRKSTKRTYANMGFIITSEEIKQLHLNDRREEEEDIDNIQNFQWSWFDYTDWFDFDFETSESIEKALCDSLAVYTFSDGRVIDFALMLMRLNDHPQKLFRVKRVRVDDFNTKKAQKIEEEERLEKEKEKEERLKEMKMKEKQQKLEERRRLLRKQFIEVEKHKHWKEIWEEEKDESKKANFFVILFGQSSYCYAKLISLPLGSIYAKVHTLEKVSRGSLRLGTVCTVRISDIFGRINLFEEKSIYIVSEDEKERVHNLFLERKEQKPSEEEASNFQQIEQTSLPDIPSFEEIFEEDEVLEVINKRVGNLQEKAYYDNTPKKAVVELKATSSSLSSHKTADMKRSSNRASSPLPSESFPILTMESSADELLVKAKMSPVVLPSQQTIEQLRSEKNELELKYQNLLEEKKQNYNIKLRKILKCKDCSSHRIRSALLPCKHVVLCKKCAKRAKTCPTCKCEIKDTIKVKLPGFDLLQK